MECTRVISLGAGLQSTAMLLMSLTGELERADLAVFADTQFEPGYVYDHVNWLQAYCRQHDFPLHTVTAGNLREVTLSGLCHLPLHVKNASGKKGILRRQCTDRFKIRPINKLLKSLGYNQVEMWLGLSLNEAGRMRDNRLKWMKNRYPLIEAGLRNADLIAWLTKNSFPVPEKSACIGCPYHSHQYYQTLRKKHREDFDRAVAFDSGIRDLFKVDGRTYVHSSCQPLGQLDFRTAEELGQQSFLNECDGYCGL